MHPWQFGSQSSAQIHWQDVMHPWFPVLTLNSRSPHSASQSLFRHLHWQMSHPNLFLAPVMWILSSWVHWVWQELLWKGGQSHLHLKHPNWSVKPSAATFPSSWHLFSQSALIKSRQLHLQGHVESALNSSSSRLVDWHLARHCDSVYVVHSSETLKSLKVNVKVLLIHQVQFQSLFI